MNSYSYSQIALHRPALTVWVLSAPACLLLFLMLMYPMVLALLYVKALLFAYVLILVGCWAVSGGRFALHRSVALLVILFAWVSFLFVLQGYFHGGLGATKMLWIYVGWPLVYSVAMIGLTNPAVLRSVVRICLWSSFAISFYGFVYFLSQLRILPQNGVVDLLSFGWEIQASGMYEGYTMLATPGMNSLPFLFPFVVMFLFSGGALQEGLLIRRFWLWVIVIIDLLFIAVCGRRALLVICVLCPLLCAIISRIHPSLQNQISWKRIFQVCVVALLVGAAILGAINVFYPVGVVQLAEHVAVGFDFSSTTGDVGSEVRRQQFFALLDGWLHAPLLGEGLGTSVYGSVRSDIEPWSFELSYLALLYQTGIVGFSCYAFGIFWIIRKGIRVIRDGGLAGHVMAAMLVGLICFLIANATNPYLSRFDGLWAVFLPLAIINDWLLRKPGLASMHPAAERAT